MEYNNYIQKQIDIIQSSNLPLGNKNYIIDFINDNKQKCINNEITASQMISNISSIIEIFL
jgi:hypothetical protein